MPGLSKLYLKTSGVSSHGTGEVTEKN
jgi:hypothetical protein